MDKVTEVNLPLTVMNIFCFAEIIKHMVPISYCKLLQAQDNRAHKVVQDREVDRRQTKVVLDREDFQDPNQNHQRMRGPPPPGGPQGGVSGPGGPPGGFGRGKIYVEIDSSIWWSEIYFYTIKHIKAVDSGGSACLFIHLTQVKPSKVKN